MFMQATIITAATFVLVIAYSYIDNHLPSFGSPGTGYSVFWRRLLLVIVGFGATIIVQIFPAPPSATKHAAESLAAVVGSIATLYAQLVSTWVGLPANAPAVPHLTFDSTAADKAAEDTADYRMQKTALKILEILSALESQVKVVGLEPSTSPFGQTSLTGIHAFLGSMTEDLSMMIGHLETLPSQFRERFKRQFAATNENLVADVLAVLAMLAASLRTGEPLPAVMPSPLIARSFALGRMRSGPGSEVEFLKKTMLQEESWPSYSVLTSSYITFLTRLDELVIFVKKAVGETYVIGGEAEAGGWGFGDLSVRKREETTDEVEVVGEEIKEK